MKQVSKLNPANLLTLFRIILIPCFFLLVYYRKIDPSGKIDPVYNGLAIATFLVILLTDFLDGQIARQLHYETQLGAFLDPLADKLLVAASYILLAAFGEIPVWLATLVVSKDLLSLLGWTTLFMMNISRTIKPSLTGKLCLASQHLVILAVLLQIPNLVTHWMLWPLTSLLTTLAFFGYALGALEKARED